MKTPFKCDIITLKGVFMLIFSHDKFNIHSLSIEEFNQNKQHYYDSFDSIAKSIKVPNFTIYESKFFDRHPTNSFLYLEEEGKIVAILYSTPHRDYQCYPEFGTNNLDTWGVNYLQVHKNFSGKGYGYLLLLAGLEDIKKKGGLNVDYTPNRQSASLVHHVVYDNNIGDITLKNRISNILSISFNDYFLNLNTSVLQLEQSHTRHPHESIEPYEDFYEYYFFRDFPEM